MNTKSIKLNQHYLPVLLIICGGPIQKGNNKIIVQSNTDNAINKKQTKSNVEEEKKPPYLSKTK
ncbi:MULTISPECIES: hypothetical protein [unclassified Sphingobacterium]|uniref:hypothetical protein n=1 Tax=unclassified Sphingobacterium TaxID=2609468 RepID=UPI0025F6726B|nr:MULTISPECIES: hypothetical protein [unclassified Sphingobacterium]